MPQAKYFLCFASRAQAKIGGRGGGGGAGNVKPARVARKLKEELA